MGWLLLACTGCRAIRRFGDSRQSIAARRLSGQGFQAMHDGRWDIAEELFTDALDVSKADDRAHWGLAEAYWNRNERELALTQMEQAVRLSANDSRLVRRLGEMHLEMGRLAEADDKSQIALVASRDSPEAWQLRGDCLHARGKLEEALAAYHRALALQPDFPEVQIQAAEIYRRQNRFDRLLATIDRMQDVMGIDHVPAKVDVMHAIAMRHLGQTDEAFRSLARAAKKDPHSAQPHIELASLSLQTGNREAAQEAIRLASAIDSSAVDREQWDRLIATSQKNFVARDPNTSNLR